MENKTKLILSSMILLLLTYFLFLGIFSSFSQSQKLGEILNSDSTLYNLQSDGYLKDSLPNSVRCIGAENTQLELFKANFKYNNTDNWSIDEYKKYYDTVLFYNNVKDNLKIDVDLANYDMTQFKNNYPGKTIFPIIISSSLKDKCKIGDEYFKFDFTKAYKPTKISFIIVGYNDYLYNSSSYEASNPLFAVVNQVDYAKLQSYIGIYSMYTTENKSESFKDLKSYLDSYNIKMNFDDTSTYFINGSNSWNNLIKSSMKLNNVINYNDAASDDFTYLVGKKPEASDEVVLTINSVNVNKKVISEIQNYLLLNDSFDLKLFTNVDNPSISKTVKVVGFYIGDYNFDIILSDSLFDQIQSEITYKSYDSSIDKSNFKVVNQKNSYLNKSDSLSIALQSNPTQIIKVIASNTFLIVLEILAIIGTAVIAIKYMQTPGFYFDKENGYVVKHEVPRKNLIYSKENIKIKLYMLLGVLLLTLIVSLLLMFFSKNVGVNVYTICWSYGAFILVILVEELVKFIVYRLSTSNKQAIKN